MRSEIMAGLDKMNKRLKEQDFIAVPSGPFLRDWREDFKREAIKRAPRWTGELQKTIEMAQDTKKFPLWARVFSDSKVARWSNFGTGLLSEDPQSAKQRYFPPPAALAQWSSDHNLDPGAVAYGIFMRGGTPPTRFFSMAADAANASMNERLARFTTGIERQAAVNV
jgi:hypothetical protein